MFDEIDWMALPKIPPAATATNVFQEEKRKQLCPQVK